MVASLYIVSLRWRPPKLVILDEQNTLSNLSTVLSPALVESRIDQLRKLVRNQCPSHHIDFYIFLVAIICVVCSAIFTFIARSLHISMWFPLLLLLVPTGLSFWTSKRRSMFLIKIKEFESTVKKTLYEFTATDQQVTWSLKRVPLGDVPITQSVRFCFMIHITELDPEVGVYNEELPSYQAATNEMVSIDPPSYTASNPT